MRGNSNNFLDEWKARETDRKQEKHVFDWLIEMFTDNNILVCVQSYVQSVLAKAC
jgi:hypothetical protein